MLRLSQVLAVTGLIVNGFSLVMIVPLLVALLVGQYDSAWAFLLCSVAGLIFGLFSMRMNPNRDFNDLTRIEGMGGVAFGWLFVAIFGSIPYLIKGFGFIDALFEAMSGFTTTGATILSDFGVFNSSMFFYRGFTQWLGGMGILVLFVAILPHLAISGRQLFFAETSSASTEKLTPRIVHTARSLWGYYFILSMAQALIMFWFGMPLIDSFSNTFATMAAGGFSPNPASIMGYKSPAIEWIIILFMLLAGSNFTLQVKALRGEWRSFFGNSELRAYLLIILVSSLVLTGLLMANQAGVVYNFRTALFQNLSILTTTGFASVDFELWSESAKTVLLVLMFIGGCSGSAGGGIKVIRLVLLIKFLRRVLLRTIYPEMILRIRLQDKTFKESDVQPAISFVMLYFCFFAIGGAAASLLESNIIVGYTGAIATLGNIGPGFGAIGPMGSFAGLSSITKLIYTFLMWIGRLEIMALAVFLRKETWVDATWR
ncbi:MAG: TrkH family potassium uptake protein [Candidatus Rifleibacteriota bacterium]